MNRFLTRKRNIGYLVLTIILLSLFSWFVITFSPDNALFHILFYLIIFGISFSLLLFLFARLAPALVYASGCTMYLFLRFLHLRHPVYGIGLFICCIAVLRLISQKETQKKIE